MTTSTSYFYDCTPLGKHAVEAIKIPIWGENNSHISITTAANNKQIDGLNFYDLQVISVV